MSNLRYNRTFKQALAVLLFFIILLSSIVVYFAVSQIQYNQLVSNMKSLEATIIDIDYDFHIKGPDEQEIYIEYIVDGVVYSRELETDTGISFSAGRGANYSIGDKIPIFYDPQNPKIIASPRSQRVGIFYLMVALSSLVFALFLLRWMIKRRKKFLVTQEEYDKEGEDIKRNKLAEKQQKKRAKFERKNRHPMVRKICRIFLIVLACLIGAAILYILIGLLLISIGY